MRSCFFIFIILLSSSTLFSQQKIDSLHLALRTATDTSYVNTLLALAEQHIYKHPDSTIFYGNRALENSQRITFSKGISRSFMKIADGNYFKNNFTSSIEYLMKAAEAFKGNGDEINYAECLNRIGINYNRLGKYADAKTFSQKALAIYGKTNDLKGQWKCLSNLGIVAKDIGDLKMSLDYNLESLKIIEKLNDQNAKNKVLTNIGNTYVALDEIDRALIYYRNALQLADSLNNKKSAGMIKNNIATCYQMKKEYSKADKYYQESLEIKRELKDFLGSAITLNNIGFNYIDKKDYKNAGKSFLEALQQQNITDISKSNSYNGLSTVALTQGQLKEAEKYAQTSYELIKNIDNLGQKKSSTETLYKLYEAKGEYKKAFEFFKLCNAYSDSLINEEKLKQIGKLEARYEFSIKEHEMTATQLQKELENQKVLSRQRGFTYLALSAFLGLLTITFFIYKSQRQKHRANQQLKEKNAEIHDQKEEIELQAEKLSELNELKDRLFAIISHDLRNPLQSLKMLLDLATTQNFSEEDFKKYLPALSKDVSYTSGLLNNLLHWTHSQMKGESLNPEHFDVKDIVENIIHLFEKQALHKGITVVNKIDQHLIVFADKNMIDLVLRNLIANAIKFCSSKDEISLSYQVRKPYAEICVADTGVGIAEENLQRIFSSENFSTRGTGNEKGTGLGLMLCKEFVEKNGGKIRVDSVAGKGTSFYFTVLLPGEEELPHDDNFSRSSQ